MKSDKEFWQRVFMLDQKYGTPKTRKAKSAKVVKIKPNNEPNHDECDASKADSKENAGNQIG